MYIAIIAEHSPTVTQMSPINGLAPNKCDLTTQLVQHFTGIAKITGSSAVKLRSLLNCISLICLNHGKDYVIVFVYWSKTENLANDIFAATNMLKYSFLTFHYKLRLRIVQFEFHVHVYTFLAMHLLVLCPWEVGLGIQGWQFTEIFCENPFPCENLSSQKASKLRKKTDQIVHSTIILD